MRSMRDLSLEGRVARSLRFWSQIVIGVVKNIMKIKGKHKEKQRALLKVWLQKCCNLATLLEARCTQNWYHKIRSSEGDTISANK